MKTESTNKLKELQDQLREIQQAIFDILKDESNYTILVKKPIDNSQYEEVLYVEDHVNGTSFYKCYFKNQKKYLE